jgi:hypothetical protein
MHISISLLGMLPYPRDRGASHFRTLKFAPIIGRQISTRDLKSLVAPPAPALLRVTVVHDPDLLVFASLEPPWLSRWRRIVLEVPSVVV